jgi:hypothetical protein
MLVRHRESWIDENVIIGFNIQNTIFDDIDTYISFGYYSYNSSVYFHSNLIYDVKKLSSSWNCTDIVGMCYLY